LRAAGRLPLDAGKALHFIIRPNKFNYEMR